MEEKPLPKETQSVFRRLSARTEEEQKATENVLKDFFKLTDAGWVHNKCERVIADFKGKAEIARENGKRGGRPPKNPQETQRVIFDNPAETKSKANQEPITNNHKPSIDNKEVADAPVVTPEALDTIEFATAWQEYISYRSLNKLKSLKRPSIQRIFDNMAKWGHDAAIQSIHNTIQNGWQGIFEPKTQFTTQQKYDHRAEKRAREFPEQIVVPLI
jgi:uncharacterized protein YdaU (DUF1376 family)